LEFDERISQVLGEEKASQFEPGKIPGLNKLLGNKKKQPAIT